MKKKTNKGLSLLENIAKAKVTLKKGQCASKCTGCACEGFK